MRKTSKASTSFSLVWNNLTRGDRFAELPIRIYKTSHIIKISFSVFPEIITIS